MMYWQRAEALPVQQKAELARLQIGLFKIGGIIHTHAQLTDSLLFVRCTQV